MDVSKAMVEKVLKTLPIGYYIKRGLNVTLYDGETSYYNMTGDEISISYPQIHIALKDLENENEVESAIRAKLYHETSHAFLTPKTLRVNDKINIFEDERIESLLRTYYERVNFRKFVKLVNNYKGEEPTCAMTAFYQIVRYRVGPRHLVNQAIKIIEQYAYLNRMSVRVRCVYYERAIHAFFDRVKEWFDEKVSKDEKSRKMSGKSDSDTTTDKSSTETDNNESANSDQSDEASDESKADGDLTSSSIKGYGEKPKKSEDDTSSAGTSADDVAELNELIEKMSETEKDICKSGKSLMHNIIKQSSDEKYIADISRIFGNAKKLDKHNGSAINAYSGIFNARSVARDDYKFFVQQNRSGNVKAFAKMHLNLFIDSSGSFSSSEETVNKLLNALSKYEKLNSNFSFDLITCGMGQKVHKKNERELYCDGGNDLTAEIFDTFKKMQFKNASNINIVLFDGDAFSDTPSYDKRDRFKAFDTSNTTIISDNDNVNYIKSYVKTAKVIYTREYVKELYSHVIRSLEVLVR